MGNTPLGSNDRSGRRRSRYRASTVAMSAVAVLALGALVTAGPVGAASGAHRSLDRSPTLAVKPTARLIGNKSVHISGKYWAPRKRRFGVPVC
jgi:hypothetical protein